VCGIAESTKDKFSIGRFGIGFKSVYTFTDRPEIHSGEEDFAVENYVQPKREVRRARGQDETQIILPLKSGDETARQEITEGFKRLGPSALLFLRHIDEINWSVEGGASGVYMRSGPESLGPNVQRITVIGQESGQQEVDQNWLVFHRDVFSVDQEKVGRVEVAFSLHAIKDAPGRWSVQPVAASPLVVFFPTVVSTNLGFLVQGPYRTTPSRDNIPRGDLWNQHLVKETAGLLVDAMRWLRDQSMLDTSALRCLPLDREKFPDGSMFAPLFDAVREALIQEPLLPSFDGGYVPAPQAKLARTQDLRELFSPEQVAMLFGGEVSAWLTGDITQDRTPEIRQYVMRELGVTEVTPVTLVPRLSQSFLEAQPDDWVLRLYEFLSGQEAALRRRLDTIPLIRLADGSHVVARENGKPKAFLPSSIETGFLRRLNAASWVPDASGELHPPSLVMFDPLGWKPNPFLLSKIAFKPPIIDQLAKEAGIDPAALDLLKKLGITSVAELTSRLGITEQPPEPEAEPEEPAVDEPSGDVYGDAKDLYGDDMPDIPPGTPDPDGGDGAKGGSGGGGQGRPGTGDATRGGGKGDGGSQGGGSGRPGERGGKGGGTGGGTQGKRSPGQGGGRPFISYVGTHPDEDEPDPDGLDQATRMRIEELAIEQIVKLEPALNRTPEGNPGYDLYENDSTGAAVRWVEVKSMTGTLADRPVGLSRTQFDCARERGAAYWLYVVEHATDPEQTRILRIQDPVSHARTFTFDRGWIEIARTEPPA
jgi:hypothetical protein